MKSLVWLALFSLMGLTSAVAQEQITVKHSCSYIGELPDETLWSFASDMEAQDAVARVMNFTGLPQNFDIMAANVPNAAAVIRGERRLILYNQGFMERVANATSNDWAAISIMAHEIGHHLSGHTLEAGGSRPKIELESDRFSGYVLQRMGASLDDAQVAMRTLASDVGSDTHPAKSARLAAIQNGWMAARDQNGGAVRDQQPVTRNDVPVQPTVADNNACPAARSGSGPLSVSYNGTLSSSDDQLNDGEHYDVCGIALNQGEQVVLDLTSNAFDTHLFVISPSGEITQNDDYEGSTSRSRIELDATESGDWRIGVTSYAGGETGAYQVNVTASSQGGGGGGLSTQTGTLAAGDTQLSSGEYADAYTMNVTAGQRIIVDLTSSEFDPFIVLVDPSGEKTQNDDFEGSASRSRLELTAGTSGEWAVVVTSYKPGEAGAYTLQMSPPLGGGGKGGSGGGGLRGTLSSSDRTLNKGEYYDAYYVTVNKGDRIQAALTSNDFDTYLVAMSSSGDRQENDDVDGSKNRSELDFRATEEGQWRILVTSYEGGERGAYNLDLTPTPTTGTSASQGFRGTLTSDDRTLDSGEYYDVYYFQAEARQTVTVEMTSNDFDTYIVVADPSGGKTDNDDFNESKTVSRLELTAKEAGEWRVTVTSYQAGETGAYRLNVTPR
ncbi:MAG: pre-peptidase C-terminal domain-containing protein [Bacteroidota bacterium]